MSSVPSSPSRRAEQNDNRVLDAPPDPRSAYLVRNEPRCVNLLRRGLLVLAAGALAWLAISAATLALALGIASALALVLALRLPPPAVHFIADALGIYVPPRPTGCGTPGPAETKRWLFVPWTNISGIRVQLLLDESGSAKGVAFSVRASAEQQQLYFSAAAIAGRDQRPPGGDRASIDVGYHSALRSPFKIAATLRRWSAPSADSAPGRRGHDDLARASGR